MCGGDSGASRGWACRGPLFASAAPVGGPSVEGGLPGALSLSLRRQRTEPRGRWEGPQLGGGLHRPHLGPGPASSVGQCQLPEEPSDSQAGRRLRPRQLLCVTSPHHPTLLPTGARGAQRPQGSPRDCAVPVPRPLRPRSACPRQGGVRPTGRPQPGARAGLTGGAVAGGWCWRAAPRGCGQGVNAH